MADRQLIHYLREERVRVQECLPASGGGVVLPTSYPDIGSLEKHVVIPQDTAFAAFNSGDSITSSYNEEAGGNTVTTTQGTSWPLWFPEYFRFADANGSAHLRLSTDYTLKPPWAMVTAFKVDSFDVGAQDFIYFQSSGIPNFSLLAEEDNQSFRIAHQQKLDVINLRCNYDVWHYMTVLGVDYELGNVKLYHNGILRLETKKMTGLGREATDPKESAYLTGQTTRVGSGGSPDSGPTCNIRGVVVLEGLRECNVFNRAEHWRSYWGSLTP